MWDMGVKGVKSQHHSLSILSPLDQVVFFSLKYDLCIICNAN